MSSYLLPRTLYHYTCSQHGLPGITRDRVLTPNQHVWLQVPLVWLTDLDTPCKWGLGLTASWVTCDRTAVRVDVSTDPPAHFMTWGQWAHLAKPAHLIRDLIEDGALPAHWWVSPDPLPVSAIHVLTEKVTT